MVIVKILAVPALILLSLLGLGAALLVVWFLLPEIRPMLRAAVSGGSARFRHRPL